MDISHGMAFASPMKIYAGTYDDITDAAVIVITAGANQKPDETRLDLIRKNSAIMKSIIGEIKKRPFEGIRLSGQPGHRLRNGIGHRQIPV